MEATVHYLMQEHTTIPPELFQIKLWDNRI